MVKEFILLYKIPLLFGLAGIFFILISVLVGLPLEKTKAEMEFHTKESSGSASLEEGIVVDIEGAVEKPGLYTLSAGKRVGDLINHAGGLTADADIVWVEKTINKAQVVADGYKLYVPRTGEVSSASQASVAGISSISSIININSASKENLESLPGVGDKTAEKIISGRPYGTIEELKTKKIVGDSVFEKIKDSISAP